MPIEAIPSQRTEAAASAWPGIFAARWVEVAAAGAVLAYGSVYAWGWASVTLLLSVGALAAAAMQIRNGVPLGWNLSWVSAAGFGALVVSQWVWHLSVDPALTLTGLIQLTACGCAFFLASLAYAEGGPVRWAGTAAWGFCGFLAGEALYQRFMSPGYIYGIHDASYATPMGPYVYHNHFAGCMDLLIPIAFGIALRPRRGAGPSSLSRLRWCVLPILGVLAVLVSGSRGGVIALGLEVIIALAMFGWPKRRLALLLAGVAVAAGLLLLLPSVRPILRRFTHFSHHSVSAHDRLLVGEACVRIFRQHPWAGTGFNTFSAVYPKYKTFDDGLIWPEAHDDYAQTLAEGGLAGCVFVLLFLIAFVSAGIRLRRGPLSRANLVRRAAFVGCCGFLLHSAGDFQFHAPANAILFFVFAAMVLSQSSSDHRTNPRFAGPCSGSAPRRIRVAISAKHLDPA